MSTSGVSRVHQGMFSTSEGYQDACGEYHEYTGGCSVHRTDTMMHVGGYHDSFGDITST